MPPQPETITCEFVLEHLEAFIDGDLDREMCSNINRHLGECDACTQELKLAEHIGDSLRSLPMLDTPQHVLTAVRKKTDRPSFLERLSLVLPIRAPRPLIAAVAAAAVLFIVVSGVLYQNNLEPTPADAAVASATAEARLAFAYIAKVSQETAGDLRADLFRDRMVAPALESLSRPNRRDEPSALLEPAAPVEARPETRS